METSEKQSAKSVQPKQSAIEKTATTQAMASLQAASAMHPLLKLAIYIVAVLLSLVVLFYIVLIGLGSTAYFQKHFLYAHKFHTAWIDDVANPQLWGFPRNQVRPFYIRNSRDEPIFAWHVLPHNDFIRHKAESWNETNTNDLDSYAHSKAFEVLKSSPDAKLVVYFHGNAGHIAQNTRPNFYRSIATMANHHVIAFDYRGFARSHPILPDEESLLDDAFTVINWAINHMGIPSSRIILAGHSLGTAVLSGAASRFIQSSETNFGGLIVISGFSHLTTMLSEYRIGGVIPVFGPFVLFPKALQWVAESFVVDDWNSAVRIQEYVATLTRTKRSGKVTFVHGLDDTDIPWTESRKLFDAAMGGLKESGTQWEDEVDVRSEDGSFILQRRVKEGEDVVVRLEILPNGGHNTIIGLPSVAMALERFSTNDSNP